MHSTCPLRAQNVHSSNAKCVWGPASCIYFEEEIYRAKCRRGKQQQTHFCTACSKDLLLIFKEKIRIGFHDLPFTHYLYYRVPTNVLFGSFACTKKWPSSIHTKMQKKWQSSLGNLAKSGYEPDMKYKSLIILWLHTDHLLIFPLKFCSWKLQNHLNFAFEFWIFLLVDFFPIEKRLVTFKWYLGLFNKLLRPGFFLVWNVALLRKCFQNKEYFVTIFWFFEKKLSKRKQIWVCCISVPSCNCKSELNCRSLFSERVLKIGCHLMLHSSQCSPVMIKHKLEKK
jgi:hypothetical protein